MKLSFIILILYLCYDGMYGNQNIHYDVHWLSGTTTIEREIPGAKKSIDIYCYAGRTKNLLALWQTVKFYIKIKGANDQFGQYVGGTPGEVYSQYTENSYGWSVIPFHNKPSKTISLDLFNSTCMAITTKEKHSIELHVLTIDIWRVLPMTLGIIVIILSKQLSGNPLFYYLSGILVGIFASFMVLVFYLSKLLPKKTLAYGMLVGGWTIGVYVFQQLWENVTTILLTYQAHLFWYTLIVGFLSFIICYRIGPPNNRRSQNLVMWTLQLVGASMIFFSSQYREATATIVVVALIMKYFPGSVTSSFKCYWLRKFPPKRKLLSNEEYYEEGARVTKDALEDLRKHCSSPDCAQWRIIMKLNDSKRFASFVEGDSHLSDDEVVDYETYAYSLHRNKKLSNSTCCHEISDDDSSESGDELYS